MASSSSLYSIFFSLIILTTLSLSLALSSNQSNDDEFLVVLTIHKDPKALTGDYFITAKSIKIDEKPVPFDAPSLLALDEETGIGGTKLLNEEPYTILHHSIYEPFVEAFARSAARRNLTRVAPSPPFGACFSSPRAFGDDEYEDPEIEDNTPVIELEIQGSGDRSVFWRLGEESSMARVSEDVACLGFVDGGLKPKNSIVLGGLQLKNNPLSFDVTKLYTSKLRVSKSKNIGEGREKLGKKRESGKRRRGSTCELSERNGNETWSVV